MSSTISSAPIVQMSLTEMVPHIIAASSRSRHPSPPRQPQESFNDRRARLQTLLQNALDIMDEDDCFSELGDVAPIDPCRFSQ